MHVNYLELGTTIDSRLQQETIRIRLLDCCLRIVQGVIVIEYFVARVLLTDTCYSQCAYSLYHIQCASLSAFPPISVSNAECVHISISVEPESRPPLSTSNDIIVDLLFVYTYIYYYYKTAVDLKPAFSQLNVLSEAPLPHGRIIIQDKVQKSGTLVWPSCGSSVLRMDISNKNPKTLHQTLILTLILA